MDIRDRIIQIIEFKGISKNAFEKAIGVSKSYIANTRSISADVAANTCLVYSDVSPDWLLTGEGSMLKSEAPQPEISYSVGRPYYNVDFIGGFDLLLNDQTINPEYLIDFKKYNEADCWCNVTGHSMEPEIAHGDMIALKKIKDISFLPFGEVYAIVTTNDMRTIKRLGPASTPNNYSLVPTNKSPEYGIQELPKDMIRYIFHVLGCTKRF